MNATEWQQIKKIFNTAIDLPENERAAFLVKHDQNICEAVQKLIKANENANDFIVESALVDVGLANETETDFYVGKQIDDYKILSEIGQGGMGTVYLAARADATFDKKVAVKLIKRGMDTTAVLKRFVMERKILAQLENPHIASLLDGGSTEEGLPYLVMEYIEGVPVTKFCDSHELSIEERLELFRKICAAVSYAHQNLVIHRDLKPSNILVTTDGTPKLLDFGIAKLLHPDWSLEKEEATATMFRLMTPEYASPEQIRGLPITTASDVYSLGVVLYELLSGERPYKIESRLPQEVANIILKEEPIRPSAISNFKFQISDSKSEAKTITYEGKQTVGDKINRKSQITNRKSLKGDLDNIILKALRKEPERRYQSVQEFSEDIRRHLVGLPVTATADTRFYRIGKFVKRHRAAVLASILMLLTILLATTVTTWQSIVAKREQAKTQQRFDQVRKLANTVLFEYHDSVAKLPGSTPIREKMVKDALEYLDNLATENIDDASLQSELAVAYFKVGEVQGAPSKSSLGDYGGGLESFKKSLAIREKLFAKDLGNEQLKLDLTRSYQMVGHLSQVTGDLPSALENYRKAFAIFDSMSLENLETKRDFATLHTRFGNALSMSGELTKAIENFRQATVIINELIAKNPDIPKLKHDLGVADVLLGDALEEAGDLNEALATQRNAFAVLEPLVSDIDADSKRAALTAFGRIGDVLFKLGKFREALEIQQKVLAADKKALEADPQNALARRDVQVDYHKIARNYSELGQMTEALSSERQTIAFCEQAVAANPESSESRGDLGVAYFHFAEMWEKSGNLTEALNYYKKAIEIEEANSNADPTNTVAMTDLSEDLMKLGDIFLKLGNRSDALANYLKALTLREKLAAAGQEDAVGRAVSAKLYESLGDYYFLQARSEKPLENWKEAKNRYGQSLAIWQDLEQNRTILPADTKKPDEIKQKIEQCEAKLK